MRPERLARSGSYSLIGSSVAALAALVLAVLIGNGLGAHGTGVFFQAIGFFTIVSQILRLGTNSSIVRSISEQHAFSRIGESWRTVVIAVVPVAVLSVLVAIGIYVSAAPLAEWLSGAGETRELEELLRDIAPYVVPSAILAVLLTATRMMRGIVAFTLLQNILLPLSRVLLVALALVWAADALGAVRAWMAVLPLWLIVTIAVLARPVILDWRARRAATEPAGVAARRFWAFSGTRAVGGALETTLEWSDVLIVAALASPSAAGVYAIATRTVRAGQVVDQAMRLAVSPAISRLLARGDLLGARTLHTKVTRAMILTSWPFYLTLATMGPAVLAMFGPEFVAGSIVLTILAGAMMIATSAGMLQSVLLQGGKSSWQMYNKAFALALSVGLNLLLVPVLGILGAALTWTACVIIDTAIASWQVHRRMRMLLEPRKLLLAMAIPLAVFGVGGLTVRLVFGATFPALIGGLLVCGAIYLVVLWFLRGRLGIVALWQEVPIMRRYAEQSPGPAESLPGGTGRADESSSPLSRRR